MQPSNARFNNARFNTARLNTARFENARFENARFKPYRDNFDADDLRNADADYDVTADTGIDIGAFEKFRFQSRYESTPRRVVLEGKSGHYDVLEPEAHEQFEDVSYSSYDVAAHGPDPIPDWVITSSSAVDTPLGILKTGKEADVHLLDRSLPGSLPNGGTSLLAVKTYRTAEHRMFHRDSAYQEGRRTRRSREGRAMAARTAFGRELLAGKWAAAEFDALGRLWSAHAPVPCPVQLIGSELMMEFIGSPDGIAAPRLAAAIAPPDDDPVAFFTELWHDLVATLELLASMGYTHGDLSPYNVLVNQGRCVLIDLPQIVDVISNPQGPQFLARDAANVADFFRRRGVERADGELLAARLADQAGL